MSDTTVGFRMILLVFGEKGGEVFWRQDIFTSVKSRSSHCQIHDAKLHLDHQQQPDCASSTSTMQVQMPDPSSGIERQLVITPLQHHKCQC